MIHKNKKPPLEFWVEVINGSPIAVHTESYKTGTDIHVREVLPESDCPNCERLEDQLYHESRKAPEVEYKLGHEIEVLKKKLELAVEALGFYANGGNSNRDIWLDEKLGYFTGKRAREALAKLEEKEG